MVITLVWRERPCQKQTCPCPPPPPSDLAYLHTPIAQPVSVTPGSIHLDNHKRHLQLLQGRCTLHVNCVGCGVGGGGMLACN